MQSIKVYCLYFIFTGSQCGACEVIKQKVNTILNHYPKVTGLEVHGEQCPYLATSYQVYTLPTMLLFVGGKESVRVGKNIDLLDFEKRLVRYIELIDAQ